MNIRIGRISQLLTPGCSWCGRCHTTWAFVEPHRTRYTDSRACFPLCEQCWAGLTPETRMPYYEQLIDLRERKGSLEPGTADQIRAAVLAGR